MAVTTPGEAANGTAAATHTRRARPAVMSRTTKVNPLLVLVSILVGTSICDWFGGTFGAFVAGLVSIPLAGAPQVIVRELWQATASKKADPGGRSLAGVSLM
jgi:predicted PurR-regulated permease PerM